METSFLETTTHELRALDISDKMLRKIAAIALHNPDTMSVSDIPKVEKVSPEIYRQTRDSTIVKLFTKLGIYNIFKFATEEGKWKFYIVGSPYKLVVVDVEQEMNGKRISFATATGVAIVKGLQKLAVETK